KLRKLLWEPYLNRFSEKRLTFDLHHFPSVDHGGLASGYVDEVAGCIHALLRRGRTVLVGCSAAIGRTGEVLDRVRTKLAKHEAVTPSELIDAYRRTSYIA